MGLGDERLREAAREAISGEHGPAPEDIIVLDIRQRVNETVVQYVLEGQPGERWERVDLEGVLL